jgi:putative transposase
MNSTLILNVFYDAYSTRKPQGNLLFHSDRGSQYRSFKVRKVMDEYNVVQSFSKKLYPWDNAVIESFFKYLKHEETNRRSFLETEDCQKCLFSYINGFYNPFRPHSYNDCLSPDEKELEFNQLVF